MAINAKASILPKRTRISSFIGAIAITIGLYFGDAGCDTLQLACARRQYVTNCFFSFNNWTPCWYSFVFESVLVVHEPIFSFRTCSLLLHDDKLLPTFYPCSVLYRELAAVKSSSLRWLREGERVSLREGSTWKAVLLSSYTFKKGFASCHRCNWVGI